MSTSSQAVQADLTDLRFVVQAFEVAMRNKNRVNNQLEAMKKFRKCASCGNEFQPRRWELCPECGSEDSHMRGDVRYCDNTACGHKWEPSPENDPCPKCASIEYSSAPRTSAALERQLEMLEAQVSQARKDVEKIVHVLPIWTTWACDIKGLGAMTLGLILSRTDFSRVNSPTAMWSHCGFGLEERDGEMATQRRHAGEKIRYDGQLRSYCHFYLAPSLLKARGKYYQYKKQRELVETAKIETGQVKSPGHAHQRAQRMMVKIVLEHIWRLQRGFLGLEAPMPYCFTSFLVEPHTDYISPEMMLESNAAAA